jgi:hypothetical protein
MCLLLSAGSIGLFGLSIILPPPVPPSPLLVTVILLWFLLILGIAVKEMSIALRARHAAEQGSPMDSNA